MNTTESLVAELKSDLAAHEAAGKHVAASLCRQQIIGHETLARLRAEYETNPSDGLASQIRFWRRKVDRDIDAPTRRRRASGPTPAADEPPQGEPR